MSYALDINVVLGSSKTGLSLSAQLINNQGVAVGSSIISGFIEIGSGNYLWHYDYFPDGFRGGVSFSDATVPSEILAFCSVNPQEQQNADIPTSEIRTEVEHQVVMSVDDLKNMLLSE